MPLSLHITASWVQAVVRLYSLIVCFLQVNFFIYNLQTKIDFSGKKNLIHLSCILSNIPIVNININNITSHFYNVCVYIYWNWYYHRADSSDWEFLTREIYLANYPIRFTRILKLCHHFRNSVVAIMEHMIRVSNYCRKCPFSMYLNLTISIYYMDINKC